MCAREKALRTAPAADPVTVAASGPVRFSAELMIWPAAEKLLASEQVRSRFVRFALARYQPPAG